MDGQRKRIGNKCLLATELRFGPSSLWRHTGGSWACCESAYRKMKACLYSLLSHFPLPVCHLETYLYIFVFTTKSLYSGMNGSFGLKRLYSDHCNKIFKLMYHTTKNMFVIRDRIYLKRLRKFTHKSLWSWPVIVSKLGIKNTDRKIIKFLKWDFFVFKNYWFTSVWRLMIRCH